MPPALGDVPVGAIVEVTAGRGHVRFSGTTAFAAGKWVGVELFERNGKNDGSVAGTSYFVCEPGYGVFVRASQVKVLEQRPAAAVPPRSASRPVSRTSATSAAGQRPSHVPRPSFSAIPPPRLPSSQPMSRTASTHSIPRSSSNQSLGSRPPSSAPPPSVPKAQRTSSTTSIQSRTASPTKSIAVPRSPTKPVAAPRSIPPPSRLVLPRRPSIPGPSRSYISTPPINASIPDYPSQIQEESLPDLSGLRDSTDEDESIPPLPLAPARPATSPVLRRIADSPVAKLLPEHLTPVSTTLVDEPAVSPVTPLASNRELEELRIKLRLLEAKRGDDQSHIRELENRLAEAEQFVALRPKLQAKLTSQQTELVELRRSLKDLSLEKDALEARVVEMSESMEMVTLDKEVADERAETAEGELDSLKERLAEAEVEIAVLKEEKVASETGTVPEGDRSSLAYVQLEKQNERLKEALIRFRDAAHVSEAEQRRKVAELEKDLASVEDLQSQYEMTLAKLEHADAQIEDLKLQLDDANGAEEMLEQLTERNLLYSEKIEEQRIVIEDLEALKELSDELEETHHETEKQLQEEIDLKSTQLREQIRRNDALEDNIADYENTIQQFREVVTTLQMDLEHLRDQQAAQQTESQALNSQSQAMLALNMKLQTHVQRNQAKNIDLELQKLDASQSKQHLQIVQLFLPQAYFESDSGATACYLFFVRLAYKTDLINSVVAQKHNLPESLNGPVSETLVGACEMRGRIAHLSALCRRFVAVLKRCDPDTFIRAGTIYSDVVSMEKRLDMHIDLLRREEFREMECITDISKMLAQFEHLAETFFAGFELDLGEQEADIALSLDYDIDTFIAALGLVQQALTAAMRDEEIHIEMGDFDLELSVFQPIARLISQSKGARTVARKLVTRIQDLVKDNAALNSRLMPALRSLVTLMTKAIDFAIQLAQGVSGYISEIRASKEPLLISQVLLTIRSIASEAMGKKDVSWEAVEETLAQFSSEAAALVPITMEADNVLKIVGNAPWMARVEEIKSKAAVNLEAERELAVLKDKTQELQRVIKAKDQNIQEAGVKIELMDRRMETVKKQADIISNLENEIAKGRKQERAYQESIEQVQAELEAAEKDIAKLKAGGASLEKGDAVGGEGEGVLVEGNLETSQLLERIESLRGALRYLRSENAYLKGQDLLKELHSLPSLESPRSAPDAPLSLAPGLIPDSDAESDAEADTDRPLTPPSLRTLAEATKHLYADVLMHAASPRVVDVSGIKPRGRARWRRRRDEPEHQLLERRLETETLGRRVKGLVRTVGSVVLL